MTRIVMTFPFALSTPGGGTQDAAELARALASSGAEVTLVTPDCDGPGRFPRAGARDNDEGRERVRSLEAAGVRLVVSPCHPMHFRLDGRPLARRVDQLLAERSAERSAGRSAELSNGAVDAVLGYWHEAFFLPSVARAHGAAFAMTGAASFSQFFGPGRTVLERVRNRRLAAIFRAADVVFARSRFTSGELERYLDLDPRRMRVVPLGVEAAFYDLPRGGPAPERIERLVYVGKLVESKGIFDALAALGQLGEGPGWSLRVIGWGDQEPVRRAAAEAGIESRVELLGGLPRAELAEELGRAQLALMPSHTESFGLAVAEAQAAGLPVVGYAAGAVPEVVEHGVSGRLVKTGDVAALAAALDASLGDPGGSFRAGLEGRQRTARSFSWERAAELTLAGLREASRASDSGA